MKQILRSLCTLLMLVAWASGFAQSSLSVDFENDLTTYTDWTFNNIAQSATVTPHTGTHYGNTNGKTTAYVQTKNKVEAPQQLTFYISKESDNTKSSNWKIQVSTDGKIWTEVKSVSAISMTKGQWVEVTQDLEKYKNNYVRVCYKGTAAIRCIDDITLTVAATKTTTSLTFPEPIINIEEGNEASFTGQTAKLEAGKTELNNAITYTTNNDAMFEAYEANVGPKALKAGAYGTAVVTATFAGDDTYAASTATYTVNYTEKAKPATTLDFGFSNKTVNINETFTATATLKAGETAISGAVTYKSSKPEVADVDANTGLVLAYAAGKATITATFAGTSEYKSSTASYDLTVVDPNAPLDNIVFDAANKAFDDMYYSNGYPNGIKEAAFKTKDDKTYAFSYSNCIRSTSGKNHDVIQMRSKTEGKGTFTSPVFDEMPNGYKVNVYYGISDNSKPLTITSKEETSATSINGVYGKDNSINNGTGYCTSIILSNGSSFTVNVGGSTCYVSKIEILPLSAPITLEEAADDTDTKIENNNGKTVDVTLTRTLTAGKWNTICLPFDVILEQMADVLKSTVSVKEYEIDEVATSTIKFKDATTMTAGVPYLIKLPEGTTIPTELVFKGVTIKNVGESDRKFGSNYKICGTFGKYTMKTDGTELFLKTDGKFYVPAVGKETMKGFRAYFIAPKNTAGAALNLSFGEATGIDGVAADAVKSVKIYNVNGQYVGTSLDALPKGLYIVGGKKVLK